MKLLALLLCHPHLCLSSTVNKFSAQLDEVKIIDEKLSVVVTGIFDVFGPTSVTRTVSATKVSETHSSPYEHKYYR